MGPQVLQGTAPAQSSHSVTASSRHPPALLWGLLHQGPPRAAGAQLLQEHSCLTTVSITCWRGICFQVWSTSYPSFFSALGARRAMAFTCSLSSFWLWLLLCSSFLPVPCPAATKSLQCKPNTIPMNTSLFKVAEHSRQSTQRAPVGVGTTQKQKQRPPPKEHPGTFLWEFCSVETKQKRDAGCVKPLAVHTCSVGGPQHPISCWCSV